MPGQAPACFGEAGLPAGAGADRGRVVEEPVPLFLAGEAGEFGNEGMGRREERFLAVQDGRVVALAVVVKVDLPRSHVEFHAGRQGRVGIGFEVGISEVRDLAREAMELDDVRLFDIPQVGPGTPLVDPQERIQIVERRAVDVKRIGRQSHGPVLHR